LGRVNFGGAVEESTGKSCLRCNISEMSRYPDCEIALSAHSVHLVVVDGFFCHVIFPSTLVEDVFKDPVLVGEVGFRAHDVGIEEIQEVLGVHLVDDLRD